MGRLTPDFNEASLGGVQRLQVANLRVGDAHSARHLDGCFTGDVLGGGDVHLYQNDAVTGPFRLGPQRCAVAEGAGAGQAGGGRVVGVELVDVDDFLGLTQGAAVDEIARLIEALGQVIVAEMVADWGEVVGVTLDDGSFGDSALAVTGDTCLLYTSDAADDCSIV